MKRAIVLIAAVALLSSLGLCSEDSLKLGSGKSIKGTILTLGAAEITVQDESGKPRTIPNDEVESFVLGDVPAGLLQGDLAQAGRDWKRARSSYRAALEDVDQGKARELHRPFILLNLAAACRGDGDLEAALKALELLRAGCADCRLRREAYLEAVAIARKKDRAALDKVVKEMESEPEPLAGLAELEKARTSLAARDIAPAREVFHRLSEKHGQPYVPEAVLGELRCLRALKKEKDADTAEIDAACRAALDRKEETSPALEQAAASLLGEVLLSKAAGDRAKLKEAVLASMRAISLGPPSREDAEDDYLRALVGAARGTLLLAQGGKAEGGEEERRRAVGYYREVLRSYKTSDWARIAGDELNRLDSREKQKG